jgi:hypothetical protein
MYCTGMARIIKRAELSLEEKRTNLFSIIGRFFLFSLDQSLIRIDIARQRSSSDLELEIYLETSICLMRIKKETNRTTLHPFPFIAIFTRLVGQIRTSNRVNRFKSVRSCCDIWPSRVLVRQKYID